MADECAIERLDTLQTVELAEGVEIRLRMAGPLLRIRAYLLDLVIRLLVIFLAGLILFFVGISLGSNFSSGLMLVGWFLMDWFYPVFFEAGKRGATPGKRIVGLRVVQANGSPITFGQAVIRNFLRVIDGMPGFTYGFGIVCCLASKRFQRIGDVVAGTVVVYSKLPPPPFVIHPAEMESCALPVALTPEEKRALISFRERAGLWSLGRQAELAENLVELTQCRGPAGVNRLLAMARRLQEKRPGE